MQPEPLACLCRFRVLGKSLLMALTFDRVAWEARH